MAVIETLGVEQLLDLLGAAYEQEMEQYDSVFSYFLTEDDLYLLSHQVTAIVGVKVDQPWTAESIRLRLQDVQYEVIQYEHGLITFE